MVGQAGNEDVAAFVFELVKGSTNTNNHIRPSNIVDSDTALSVVDEVTSEGSKAK